MPSVCGVNMISVIEQNKAICDVLDDLKAFLCAKNNVYSGKVVDPEQTINVRIVDKIRRLESENPNFDGEDTEKDLLGYLVIKMALKRLEGR